MDKIFIAEYFMRKMENSTDIFSLCLLIIRNNNN